ncbi:hypothetical protein GQ600_24338 [Phytophthora cactorum]|nr:hypothetical protein GQ600_24338 [Phytophthora cactorum]
MDILESKLKDQQEELQKLRSKVDASNVFLCAECEVLMETKLQWKEINSETFVLDDDNTSIVALRMAIVLEMNGAEIQTAAICYASCYDNATALDTLLTRPAPRLCASLLSQRTRTSAWFAWEQLSSPVRRRI